MDKFKVGDVVYHRSTGDRLLVLFVKARLDTMNKPMAPTYIVRTPDYQRAELEEFELAEVAPGSTFPSPKH